LTYTHIHSSHAPTTPASPTFPYTTLFRSGARVQRSGGTARTSSAVARSTTPPTALTRALCILALYQRPASDAEKRTYSASSASSDRKSTRLNSSHVSISYAVFCLKKKNHT